jgi:L-ribulose-5-phosphate 3-epimerase
MNRRVFITKASIGSLALPILASLSPLVHSGSGSRQQICYFSKHLQWLGFDDLAAAIRESGFDGVDLTVRPGGHIEPGNVGRELPKAIAAFEKRGLSVPMVASGIKSSTDPGIDDYLKALADNGIKYYRTGYMRYDHNSSIEANITRFQDTLRALADKNDRYGVCGVYQNHSGTRLGASIWDLYLSLKNIDPQSMGCQFDIRHATFEGGRSWENDLRCIHSHIQTTVLKDFYWSKDEKGQWRHRNVPLGEGMVNFDRYFRLCGSLNIAGPISIHTEYELLSDEEQNLRRSSKISRSIEKLRHDVEFTRKYLV